MSAALKLLRDYNRQPVVFNPNWDMAAQPDDWDDPYAHVDTPDFDPPAGALLWAHHVDHTPPWHGDSPEEMLLESFARYVARRALRPTTNRDLELSRNGWSSRRRPSQPSRHSWSYAQQIDHVRRLTQRLVAALYYRECVAQDDEQLVKLTRSIAINAAGIRVRLEARR